MKLKSVNLSNSDSIWRFQVQKCEKQDIWKHLHEQSFLTILKRKLSYNSFALIK